MGMVGGREELEGHGYHGNDIMYIIALYVRCISSVKCYNPVFCVSYTYLWYWYTILSYKLGFSGA